MEPELVVRIVALMDDLLDNDDALPRCCCADDGDCRRCEVKLLRAEIAKAAAEGAAPSVEEPKHCTERKCDWDNNNDSYLPCVEMSTHISLGHFGITGHQPGGSGDSVFDVRFCPFCGSGELPVAFALMEWWK